MDLKDLFLRLVEVDSPSGYEEPMMRYLTSELGPLVDEVHITTRGNVVGVKKGTDRNAPSVAIAAHMDQVGLVVSNIDEKGFLRFRTLGRPLVRALLGQHVKIRSSKGPVIGVIGMKPGHITTPEEAKTVPPLESMYIDVGASSPEEVEYLGIGVGTPVVSNVPPLLLKNDIMVSPGSDDKAGLAALIAVAHELRDKRIPSTVYYVGTVEEEIGLKGAFSALYDLDIDMAVAIDTTPAGYQPGLNMLDLAYEAGKGPVLHLGEQMFGMIHTIHHYKVREWLEEAAEAEGIPYQKNYMYTGTDATALARTRAGIPTTAVGIARRYSHSQIEAFYMKDLEDLVKILVAAVKGLEPGFDLQRA
jgi:endoglucanase